MVLRNQLVSMLAIFFACTHAYAANFSLNKNGDSLEISGRIEKGDYIKLVKYIKSDQSKRATDEKLRNLVAFLHMVVLDSPGGDVNEAMKIARLVEKSYANTSVRNGRCYSSCFLIWASGTSRLLFSAGEIGIHRMSLVGNDFSIARSEEVVGPASQVVESYLLRAGIPRKIVDKMNETSSASLFRFDSQWLVHEGLDEAIMYRPSFIDVAQKKCGADPVMDDMKAGRPVDEKKLLPWRNCIQRLRYQNQVIVWDLLIEELDNTR